ncbi:MULTISPECIES: hypothetical protein [unclassified Streptomyces]|uniref:hypothetical protein n=1 Tax=unclassified Streptomyces TaxID=2593676 RepID=UPI002DDADE61|nr:hypothetical protein [Streptomyces sp. NBC_01750]WSB00660.1 hypothetical protein OIE54_15915 [Streptomyces sp. NBC_01794]WSD34983.1 hypothetical protein OG966_25700 [Streptomyces sp. NBC_01750]
MQGEVQVGELREYGVDQPTFLCHFVPGPGWEAVQGLFEAWAAVQDPDPDGSRTAQTIRPLMDLGLTLVPTDGGTPLDCFRTCIVRIHGDTARLRY